MRARLAVEGVSSAEQQEQGPRGGSGFSTLSIPILCGGRRGRVTGLRRLGGARPGGQPLRSPTQEAQAIARSLLPLPCLLAGGA